jgi:hypothetical protein
MQISIRRLKSASRQVSRGGGAGFATSATVAGGGEPIEGRALSLIDRF